MKVSSRKTALLFVAALMVAMSCLFVGCSSSSSASSAAASASAEVVEEQMLVLGEDTDSALNLILTNGMDQEIANIAILPAGTEQEPLFLMAEDESLAGEKQVSLFTEPVDENAVFNIVMLVNDQTFTLHNVNLATLDEGVVRMNEGILYLEAVVDGNVVSTFQEEYDIANPPVVEEVYEEPVYYSEPAPAAPAQTEDRCVSDIVLR